MLTFILIVAILAIVLVIVFAISVLIVGSRAEKELMPYDGVKDFLNNNDKN